MTEAPINQTVDFERAKERLEAHAGRLFNSWRKAKNDPAADPAAVQAALDAYVAANDRAKDLRASDAEGIRKALEGDA
ncbi:hypothetical protein [Dyella ginsengisoli]|uniref:hypothetical protein n=1 Tax=Dyella ginsengisoli TaxID=363848 RepID=UPI000345BA78|nr:hypothetical protein [Dyella ginsengisoli]